MIKSLYPGILAALSTFLACSEPRGYIGKADNLIADLRNQARYACEVQSQDTHWSSRAVSELTEKRDEILTKARYELGCERWECVENRFSDPPSRYVLLVKDLKTCGEQQRK